MFVSGYLKFDLFSHMILRKLACELLLEITYSTILTLADNKHFSRNIVTELRREISRMRYKVSPSPNAAQIRAGRTDASSPRRPSVAEEQLSNILLSGAADTHAEPEVGRKSGRRTTG